MLSNLDGSLFLSDFLSSNLSNFLEDLSFLLAFKENP
jgi:hypothetical protein